MYCYYDCEPAYAEFIEYAARCGASDISTRDGIEELLHDCAARMMAYIMPNHPRNGEQKTAFKRAVFAQLLFELSPGNAQLNEMPTGVKSFSVNGFSATMQDGANTADNPFGTAGICAVARSELLYAGLLYRGVASC